MRTLEEVKAFIERNGTDYTTYPKPNHDIDLNISLGNSIKGLFVGEQVVYAFVSAIPNCARPDSCLITDRYRLLQSGAPYVLRTLNLEETSFFYFNEYLTGMTFRGINGGEKWRTDICIPSKSAKEIYDLILDYAKKSKLACGGTSLDEVCKGIMQLKELLDCGAITAEEFAQLKQKYLK